MPLHLSRRARHWALMLAIVALSALHAQCRADISVYGLYDVRHWTDPADNARNFPVIELKGFFPLGFGSFTFKSEMDLNGTKSNQSQVYTELDQSIKLGDATLWGAPLSLHVGYSGGLGVFNGGTGGYYVQNAYSVGPEYGFRLGGAYCDAYVALRYTYIGRPSFDPMMALWLGKYFFDYKLLVANSLEAWTAPDGGAQSGSGTIASWELESEVWYKVAKYLSVGTYIRTTRNVYSLSNRWVIYPSVGVRYSF